KTPFRNSSCSGETISASHPALRKKSRKSSYSLVVMEKVGRNTLTEASHHPHGTRHDWLEDAGIDLRSRFPLHRGRSESAGAGDSGVKEAVARWDRLPTMWIVEPLPEWRRPADADSTLPEWPDLLP